MTVDDVMKELAQLGDAQTKKTHMRHGAPEPLFGVQVRHLKKIQKALGKDYRLALDLYDTGNSDAMYLAGLIADETKMTKRDLQHWVERATWKYTTEYTVPWVAGESAFAHELGTKWIDSKKETIASSGWSTLATWVSRTPDEDLDLKAIEALLSRVLKTIDASPDRVRYVMNGFIIAVGSFVVPLSKKAIDVAKKLGKVDVDVGDTACKTPSAVEYIAKVAKAGKTGKKRATCRC